MEGSRGGAAAASADAGSGKGSNGNAGAAKMGGVPNKAALLRAAERKKRLGSGSSAEKPRWGSTCLSTCPRSGAPRSTACPSPRATAAAAAAAGSQTPRRPRARPPIRSGKLRTNSDSAKPPIRRPEFRPRRARRARPRRPRRARRDNASGTFEHGYRSVRQTSPRANARNWSRRCRRTSK